ncbi:hypothetical protein L596_013409 [Steinernema carpocapsae]|uniref:Uncharacterized protein n=1 Tax=Steinernema carpocapsae TaxID=34508 RepID=A0A4U5P0J8_STECR|nr:hypothetical protein L596_013409 [Steinernema carpocapsae]
MNTSPQCVATENSTKAFVPYPNIAILRSLETVSRHPDARIVISVFENLPSLEMSGICKLKQRQKIVPFIHS